MKHRILSWLLVLAMVLSLIPTIAFAEENTTAWTKVEFADIQASDTVAITMTKDGVTYALPTSAMGTSSQPLAEIATISGTTLTTSGEASAYGWTISRTEGGYYIQTGENYLNITATNNGVRIDANACVWTLIEDGYLAAIDPSGTVRYLGVYAGATPDWRCYKAYATGNIAGEELGFWVLDPNAAPSEPQEPTEPSESEQPSEPSESEQPDEPAEPEVPSDEVLAELTTELENGLCVYIYNPKNTAVLTASASGTQLVAATGAVENDQLTVTEEMEELTVAIDADGYYSFINTAGEYLTYGDAANVLTFEAAESENSLWTVEEAEGGFYVKCANVENLALEYYKGNYTIYSFQSYNTGAYLMQFFTVGTGGGFTDKIEAGDQVVIYNPTYSMALSTAIFDTEKNYDFVGTELVLSSDEQLSGYSEENIWTVGVNEDGSYTFTAADGQKLAVVNRTHLGFSEENTAWTLELIDGKTDEYFVKGPIGTYLEWYANNNCWAAYYNPSEAMYAIRFYLVGGSVQPSNVVATPKATVSAGVVDSGTEIGFTCKTEGATIFYKTDGDWTEYTAPIAIIEDTTFTVKAVKEGMEDSKEVTYAYTIYVPPVLGEKQAQLVTDVSELASGDQIIIVTMDYDYALGVTQKANNRDYGNVIKAYDRCSYDEGTQIITLESGVEDGTFALYATNGDFPGYLYASSESGNLLRTQEGKDLNASFTITISSDGTAQITSLVNKTSNTIRYNTVGIFSCYGATGQKPVCIYKLDGQEKPGLPEENDVVVIYNQSAKGVVADMGVPTSNVEGTAIMAADASISNGKAVCANGAFLFKVEKNGEYYRFYNESFGYLCAAGTGGLGTYYGEGTDENVDWLLEEYNGGYKMTNRSAALLQYVSKEYFSTCAPEDVTDRDSVTFRFYECSNEKITDGIVNEPRAIFGNPATAYAGQKYLLSFTVESVFGVKELKVMLGEAELEYSLTSGRYTAVIPAALIVGETLTVTVIGLDNKDVEINSVVEIEVNDEPVISDVTPIANAQTGEDKRPVISAKLANVGEEPEITMTLNGEAVAAVYADDTVSYQPAEDLADGRVKVVITVTRKDGKSASKSWSFTVGESNYVLMFGQLHSHTGEYSDGSGTLQNALDYIAALPEEANVDFVAFTDHSNYFDKSGEANPEQALYDLSLATTYSQERWSTYKSTIAEFNQTQEGIIAIAGFEMTWSGGPGHMNTFVTEGIVSRNNTTLNNKSADAGMRAYYALLSQDEGVDSITQLNHPGTLFGNFTDFSYYDPIVDTRVYLVEVGNGEGPIHGSGYYPSYEQYTLALDKGWHIAPTNNQDNHKSKWGNGNDARDVVLAEEFTEEAIYEAIRNYRVYATEDKNLEIMYTVNDLPMGTIIEKAPETLNFSICLMDPDEADSIVKVELIVNSGKVAYTWDNAEELASGAVSVELEPEYSYYYVRVTQADNDIAVTAPVWVGESLKVGMREVTADTETPIAGEEVTLSTTLYNDEGYDALIKSVVYTTNGAEVLYVDDSTYVLSAGSEQTIEWKYTPASAKLTTITVTVILETDGKEYTFSGSVELDVQDADAITYIGIDASHANEYVSGYNKDLVANFVTMAGESMIRVEMLTTSEALVKACGDEKFSAIVLNVPSRRLSEAKDYSDEELDAIAAFNARGGIVIVTGGGDSNDKIEPHMAATQNRLLEALGSSLRLSDDGTYEDTSYSLDFATYGDNALTKGLSEPISYYGGSSVYAVDAEGNAVTILPESVSAVLFANAETISKDADNDGLGGQSAVKYAYAEGDERLLVMAMETLEGKGMILVAGAAFMNDYDLVIPAENGNNALCENLFELINPVKITDIANVRTQTEEGYKFVIEGIVTTNASGYDKETAFFDCIYVQDLTGGINCFPVAGEYKLGDVVRVEGTTDFYQGEIELQVLAIEKIGEAEPVEPTQITAAQLNDRSVEGKLVSLSGFVTEIATANDLVESIYIKDESGEVARVFIDGYITATKVIENLEVGCEITAIGLASYDDTYAITNDSYARIRVRDRAEITAKPHEHSYENGVCTGCGAADPDYAVELPFVDVPEDEWYRPAVEYVYVHKLMNGMSETTFEPDSTLTRAMLVTILYRMAGVPETEASTVFTDVGEDTWYADAVAWGYENEIVKGMSDTQFAPDESVTREQMVTFLYRYAKYVGVDVSASEDASISDYTDADSISAYASDSMLWAIENGIINGMGDNTLEPLGTATRAQVAKVIMLFDLLLNESV